MTSPCCIAWEYRILKQPNGNVLFGNILQKVKGFVW